MSYADDWLERRTDTILQVAEMHLPDLQPELKAYWKLMSSSKASSPRMHQLALSSPIRFSEETLLAVAGAIAFNEQAANAVNDDRNDLLNLIRNELVMLADAEITRQHGTGQGSGRTH
jgi:hypothetical protein